MKNFVAVCPFGLHCAPNSATRAKDHPLVFFSSFFLQFFHDENYFIFFFFIIIFSDHLYSSNLTQNQSKITIDSKLDSKASSLRNTLCWFRILESGNLKIAGSEWKDQKGIQKGRRDAFAKGVEAFWLADTVACEHADIRIPIGHSPLAFFPFPLNPTRSNCAEKRAKFLTQFNWKETLKYVECTGSACPVNILGLKKREMLEIKKIAPR